MALQREAIYTAMLAKLVAVPGWAVAPTRRLKDLAKIDNAMQPTAFLCDSETESAEFRNPGLPLKWKLQPEIIVYARTDDENAAPGTTLNAILTAIETAFEATNADGIQAGTGGQTTLGKIVLHCRIASVQRGDGYIDGQAVARIFLEVSAMAG